MNRGLGLGLGLSLGLGWAWARLRFALVVLAWVSLSLTLSVEASAAEPSLRRFALLVGANDGGQERELLRYAATDAELLGRALSELGGVDERGIVVLVDPSVAGLEQGFRTIHEKIRQAESSGDRIQFFFYYSGHSDESGLLLGGVHVDYKRLRGLIDQVDASVRIGVLDSCSSGAFTRFKGGKKKPPFLVGSAANVEGHAYLTSSSADEAAQESDRIGGSFFTHFLVTGLRGAADFDGDRQVTLSEAYQFAFDETLARTETTAGGPQHAAYDIQLAGSGDLVITDLRKPSAKLEIASAVVGRIYIRDRRGKLAAELFKAGDAGAITLALEPGNYSVTIDDGRALHRAEVSVRTNKTTPLEIDDLDDIPIEGTRRRGDAAGPIGRPAPPPGGYTRVPFNIGLAPRAELNAAFGRGPKLNNFSFSLTATGAAAIEGVQIGLGAVWATDYMRGVQLSIGAVVAKHDAVGLQTAIGAAWTRGHMRGAQLGVTLAYANQLTGVQGSAINIAGNVRGVQIGLGNVTRGRVEGVQIGLINYADEADASIGLIPITKQGGVWFDLWTSDVQLINVALKFRARRTYTFLTAGIHPIGGANSTGKSWSGGIGFGGPLFSRDRLSLELDAAVRAVNPGGYAITRSPLLVDTLRLALSYRPARRFAVWGAITANLAFDFEPSSDGRYRPGFPWAQPLSNPSFAGPGVKLWPGYAVGFEF